MHKLNGKSGLCLIFTQNHWVFLKQSYIHFSLIQM